MTLVRLSPRPSPRHGALLPSSLLLLLPLSLGACPDDTSGTWSEESATGASSTSGGSMTPSTDPSGPSSDDPATTGSMMTSSTTAADDSTTTLASSTSSDDSTTTSSTDSTGSIDSGSTGSTGSTTDASGWCGDKSEDPGEECDRGDAMNGQGSYGGCNDDCTLQPHCNDGKHQSPYEECDPSDPLFAEAAVCTDACTWKGVIIFLTSKSINGDLGGVDGADAMCRSLAEEAGLQKWEQYNAWLSVGASTAASRVPLVDRPYYRLDGLKIAETSEDLLNSKLLQPANISEHKEDLGIAKVWTNSLPDGTTTSTMHDCQSFSSPEASDKAYVGLANKTDGQWTHADVTSYCSKKTRLYCFSPAF